MHVVFLEGKRETERPSHQERHEESYAGVTCDGLLPGTWIRRSLPVRLCERDGHDEDHRQRQQRHGEELVVEVDVREDARHAEHAHEVEVDEVHVGQELPR